MQTGGWLRVLKMLHFLHTLVWDLEQPLPTTDTWHSPEEWLPPLSVPKCFVSSLGPHISWDLQRAELVPRWGLADGEWPDPTWSPQRDGTDPYQRLQEAAHVTSTHT